ncbi:unnamed protein product [Rotaria sordida]|uniref:Uncharacterized protein n=2 Tax=Rotaria sordida TaxID=392033 RepID=A0A814ECJ8_9BILA|nr:unnamed protein product [Rotaria sordida]
MMIDGIIQGTDRRKIVSTYYSGQTSIRRQRIERWINKDRSTSIINNKKIRSSKQSDNTLFQTDRHLNVELFQLGEQREKFIEQCNFDQKLFANKQALLHKKNPMILETLNHVQKHCKYTDFNGNNEILIDATVGLTDNDTNKTIRSRPLLATEPIVKRNLFSNVHTQTNTSSKEISRQHNKKHTESSKKPTERKMVCLYVIFI